MNIVWKKPDGSIAITGLVQNSVKTSQEHAQKMIAMNQVPSDWVAVAFDTGLIRERVFRDAHVWDEKSGVCIDMGKARDIWRDNLREARKTKLQALDVLYQRADESADAKAKADIVSQKQALRDVTDDPAIDAAQTAEDLKAVWPDALK